MEETTIGSFEVGVGGVSIGECVSKLAVENLAFLVIPLVHWAEVGFLGGGNGLGGVRVELEGCVPNDG
jgi:hypothetical protein